MAHERGIEGRLRAAPSHSRVDILVLVPQAVGRAADRSHWHYDTARKLFVFRQFHTEGFVNTYVQHPSADDNTIVFVSEAIENIPAGYRARETYTILSRDDFTERFEIAEPGKDFEMYSEARLKGVR